MKLLKKIPIHPAFLLLLIWFAVSGRLTEFFVFFIVLLLHELGHYFTAKKLGYKLSSFYLTPCGAQLSYGENNFSEEDELKIALAGPMINILTAIFLTAIWWLVPESYNYTNMFVFQSLFLGLFNLLPAYPLDGGRVVTAYLSKRFSRVKILKGLKISNIAFAVIFFILFLVSCFINYNPSLILMVIFLLSGIMDTNKEVKLELTSFYKKQNKNFTKVRILYVSADVTFFEILKKIEKNKFTLFYISFKGGKSKLIPESTILNLSLKFPLTARMEEIISQ